jgi:hypothetical protein
MQKMDFATAALYFRHGLEAGVLSEADTRDWVLRVVGALQTPPVELIEALSSRSYSHLLETLKDVPGCGDSQLAGQWLLFELRRKLVIGPETEACSTIARQAVQIARSTDLDEAIQSKFIGLDASVEMAHMGYTGSPDECRNELIDALSQYAKSPQLCSHDQGMSV